MKLTDNNIDKNSARYWCFLADKSLKDALKDVIKNVNSKYEMTQLNEFVAPLIVAGGKIAFDTAISLGAWYGLDWLLSSKEQLPKHDFNKMYENFKTQIVDPEQVKGIAKSMSRDQLRHICYWLWRLDQPDSYEDWRPVRHRPWIGDPYTTYEKYTVDNTKVKHEAAEYLSRYNDSQVALAMVLYKQDRDMGSRKFWQKHGNTPIDPVDWSVDKILMPIKQRIESGNLTLCMDNGQPKLLNNEQVEELQAQIQAIADKQAEEDKKAKEDGEEKKPEEKKSEEKKSEEKPEEKPTDKEKKQEQDTKAAEQSVEDSPDIQQNSNAVAWIAGAVAAAVALPYLWKRLKQLTDYIKSGKTFAKCQFRCSENDQEYSFEYDLKQKEWKLKFAGSTALKYTPYPSDDEVNSFVKTKFAKEFVDEIEQQLKSLYSAKDKKLLFKAVQAAGKDGSDLIKYLFDNQKAIESSMYKINKYKLWESILKKYKMWESARLQERARH